MSTTKYNKDIISTEELYYLVIVICPSCIRLVNQNKKNKENLFNERLNYEVKERIKNIVKNDFKGKKFVLITEPLNNHLDQNDLLSIVHKDIESYYLKEYSDSKEFNFDDSNCHILALCDENEISDIKNVPDFIKEKRKQGIKVDYLNVATSFTKKTEEQDQLWSVIKSNKLLLITLFLIVLWIVIGDIFDLLDISPIRLGWTPYLISFLALCCIRWLYLLLNKAKSIYLEFIIPIILIVYTVCFGWYGFYLTYCGEDILNSLFRSFNLLSLNSSIIEKGKETNAWLDIARFSGVAFLVWAFFVALSKAIGRQNYNRVKFWFYRVSRTLLGFFTKNQGFDVIIGDSSVATNLAIDIRNNNRKKRSKLFYLSDNLDTMQQQILDENKVWYSIGNTNSIDDLEKTYYNKANQVFITKETDDENVQTLIEILDNKKALVSPKKVSIHISQLDNFDLVSRLCEQHGVRVHIYNLNQQIARKLLKEHQVDRFDDMIDKCHIKIFGFTRMAEAILLQILHLMHYPIIEGLNREFKISVYYTLGDKPLAISFRERYKALFENNNSIWKYAFPFSENISLKEFNTNTFEVEKFYSDLKDNECLSIYYCLQSGLDSSTWLSRSLPYIKEHYLTSKTCNIKLFLQCNVGEQTVLKQNFSKKAYPTAIEFFGNLTQECTSETINDTSNIELGMFIDEAYNLNTYAKYDIDEENETFDNKITKLVKLKKAVLSEENEGETEKTQLTYYIRDEFGENIKEKRITWKLMIDNWEELSENDKMSNLMAADHTYIKKQEWKRNFDLREKGVSDDEIIDKLAEAEHRRWCAEKLLAGYTYSEMPEPYIIRHKTSPKNLRALVEYQELDEWEKQKDRTQVQAILKLNNT